MIQRYKKDINGFFNRLKPLAIFIFLATFVNCPNCNNINEQSTTNGTLQISLAKTTLQDQLGSQDRLVSLKIQLASGTEQPNTVAKVDQFKLQVTLQQTGDTPGSSKVAYTAYDADGKETSATITDGATTTEPVYHFFKTSQGGTIEWQEIITTNFTLQPSDKASQLTLTFQLLDQAGTAVGQPCTAQWRSGPRYMLELDTSPLEADQMTVKKTGEVILLIKKEGNGGVQEAFTVADQTGLRLVATTTGTASLEGGKIQDLQTPPAPTTVTLSGAAPAHAIVNLKAARGSEVSTLNLSLTHNGAPTGPTVSVKVPTLPNASLAIRAGDPIVLQGQQRNLILTVTAISELLLDDMKAITLQYETKPTPNIATPTLTKMKAGNATDVHGMNLFQVTNKTKMNTNEAVEITLKIDPKTADKIVFTNIRLHGSASEMAANCYIPTVTWSKPSVNIVLQNPAITTFYGKGQEDIAFEITSQAAVSLAEAQGITLAYKAEAIQTGEAAMELHYLNAGGIWVNAHNKTLADILQPGAGGLPIGTTNLVLKVVRAGGAVSDTNTEFTGIQLNGASGQDNSLCVTWNKPSVSIQLQNPNQGDFNGYTEMDVVFIVQSNGANLIEADLQALTLTYTGAKGTQALAYSDGTNWVTAKDVNLQTLLSGAKLLAKDTATPLKLSFIPDATTPEMISLTDIKLAGSQEPDSPSNNVSLVTWKQPAIKITLQNPKDNFPWGYNEEILGKFIKAIDINITTGDKRLTQLDLDKLILTADLKSNSSDNQIPDIIIRSGNKEETFTENAGKLSLQLNQLLTLNDVNTASHNTACKLVIIPTNHLNIESIELSNVQITNAYQANNINNRIQAINWEPPRISMKLAAFQTDAHDGPLRIGYDAKSKLDRYMEVGLKIANYGGGGAQCTKEDLKAVEIGYTSDTPNVTLMSNGLDINNSTLYDFFQRYPNKYEFIPAGMIYTFFIRIENKNNAVQAKFTNIKLIGTFNTPIQATIPEITWKAPTFKLNPTIPKYCKVNGYGEAVGARIVPCEVQLITPNYTATKADLEKITVSYTITPGATLLYKDKDDTFQTVVSKTTKLYDLLQEKWTSMASGYSQTINLYIEPTHLTAVDVEEITLEDVLPDNTNPKAHIIPKIEWRAPIVTVTSETIGKSKTKQRTIKISTALAEEHLSEEDLKRIKLNFNLTSTAAIMLTQIKNGTVTASPLNKQISSGMTLQDILGITSLAKGAEVVLTLTSTKPQRMSNIVLEGGVSNNQIASNLTW